MKIEDSVNKAITEYLLPFYNTDDIKNKFGDEVFASIDQIAAYATNNVIWAGDNDEENHEATIKELSIRYPFLTEASKVKIADVAAYFWKAD